MTKTVSRLGFWCGVLSALFAILWFATFAPRDAIAPMPDWQDLQAYAEAFSPMRILYVYPSLLLPLTYLVLLACVHLYAAEEAKVWSLSALAVGIVYAAMASINYNIQAVAVRQSLAAGETAGIEMLIPDNARGVFGAMANSYVYLALSMVLAGFVFDGGRLERWIRWLLVAQVVTAIGQVAYTMFDVGETAFIITSMVWVIGAPAAFVLMGVLFRRGERRD